MIRNTSGFTAIELLVAIIVAVVLLGGGYQLYSVALTTSGTAYRRATASNSAYELLRSTTNQLTTPCVAKTIANNLVLPTTYGLAGARYTTTVTCPYGATSNLNLFKTVVNYNNPEATSVTRSLVVAP